MKDCCISSYTGKPKSCYETIEQAQNSADYMKMKKGIDFYPYKCSQCGYYHLALKENKINFSEMGCNCTDSNGNKKRLYKTYEDAVKAKSIAESKREVELNIYKCPESDGWHLAHKKNDSYIISYEDLVCLGVLFGFFVVIAIIGLFI